MSPAGISAAGARVSSTPTQRRSRHWTSMRWPWVRCALHVGALQRGAEDRAGRLGERAAEIPGR